MLLHHLSSTVTPPISFLPPSLSFPLYLFILIFFKSSLLSSSLSLWLPLPSPSHSGGFHVNKKLFLDPVFFLFCIPPCVFLLLLLVLLAFVYLKPHKYRWLPSSHAEELRSWDVIQLGTVSPRHYLALDELLSGWWHLQVSQGGSSQTRKGFTVYPEQ